MTTPSPISYLPRRYTPEELADLLVTACEDPDAGGTRLPALLEVLGRIASGGASRAVVHPSDPAWCREGMAEVFRQAIEAQR